MTCVLERSISDEMKMAKGWKAGNTPGHRIVRNGFVLPKVSRHIKGWTMSKPLLQQEDEIINMELWKLKLLYNMHIDRGGDPQFAHNAFLGLKDRGLCDCKGPIDCSLILRAFSAGRGRARTRTVR